MSVVNKSAKATSASSTWTVATTLRSLWAASSTAPVATVAPLASVKVQVADPDRSGSILAQARAHHRQRREARHRVQPEEEGERKVAVPLYWGKRLQDPKYFIWIPTLHTPDSFRGPGDDAPAGPKTGAEMAQEMANSGGECSIM